MAFRRRHPEPKMSVRRRSHQTVTPAKLVLRAGGGAGIQSGQRWIPPALRDGNDTFMLCGDIAKRPDRLSR